MPVQGDNARPEPGDDVRPHPLRRLARRFRHPTQTRSRYAHARIERLRQDLNVWGGKTQEAVGYVGDLAADHETRLSDLERDLLNADVSPDNEALAQVRQLLFRIESEFVAQHKRSRESLDRFAELMIDLAEADERRAAAFRRFRADLLNLD